MFDTYFIEQMVGMIHAPFFLMNTEGKVLKKFGGLGPESDLIQQEWDNIFKGSYNQNIPLIYTNHGLVFGLFICNHEGTSILAAGPMTPSPLTRDGVAQLASIYKINKKHHYVPPVCPMEIFVLGILLVHWHLTGQHLSMAQLREGNKDYYQRIRDIYKQISHDLFIDSENVKKHNPYEQELRELESIEKGDLEALSRSISEIYEGEIGVLAKEPLRSHKNVTVGNITLASRAAIRGGVTVEQAFSLADSLCQQLEEIDNIPEVEVFKQEAKFAYAQLVQEEKLQQNKDVSKTINPLVNRVKEYVFSHLHDAIRVSNIAKEMNVNPDYLSYVFANQEKITITQYIRHEKIRRGKNLLKYSDYPIRDIAFYLGFCSQSHFARVFLEEAGMKPSDYRKSMGMRDTWKIK